MRRRGILLAVLVVTGFLAATPGVASANHAEDDGGLLDSLLEDESGETEDDSLLPDIQQVPGQQMLAALSGQVSRRIAQARLYLEEPTPNNETATQLQADIQANEDLLVETINEQATLTENDTVHKVTVSHEDSPEASFYVLLNRTDDGNVTGIETLEPAAFADRNATVDHYWVIDGLASQTSAGLAEEITLQLTNGELNAEYQAELAGTYCSVGNPVRDKLADPGECDIRSSYWMDESDLNQTDSEEDTDAT